MKKIAIIVPGGIGKPGSRFIIPALSSLIERLSDSHEVIAYCAGSYDQDDESYLMGKAVVKYLHVKNSRWSFLMKGLSLWRNIKRDHEVSPFDLIHAFGAIPTGLIAIFLSKVLKIPSLVTFRGGELGDLPQINYGNMVHFYHRWIVRYICSETTGLVLLSRFQEKLFHIFTLTTPHLNIVPFGVDTNYFKPILERRLNEPIQLLHVANLTPVKDQITLLKAFSKIRTAVPAKLTIIGEDYSGGSIQGAARSLGVTPDVEFLGQIPNEELPSHYAKAHFLLLTSLYEGEGVVCVEAAAIGTVVCGTNVGIIHDLSEYMVAVEPGDFTSLAEKVITLYRDSEAYSELQLGALNWVKQHDLSWTTNEYIRIYEELSRSTNR